MAKYLINEEYEVEEAGAEKRFARGERREDYADGWRDTGNVILLGLPGSGRNELARLLGERTGQPVHVPATPEESAEVLAGRGAIIVLDDGLAGHDDVRPLVHGAGKVFYLLADTRLLSGRVAERDGVEDAEGLWRELSARLAVAEPVFYSALHFILQGSREPADLVEDALEKIGY